MPHQGWQQLILQIKYWLSRTSSPEELMSWRPQTSIKPVPHTGRLREFILFPTDYLFHRFIPQDFFILIASGTSEGLPTVLKQALESFSQFISDDFEECCFYCVQNHISIWDYYGTNPGDNRIPAVLNEMWVEYLIQAAAATSQLTLKRKC